MHYWQDRSKAEGYVESEGYLGVVEFHVFTQTGTLIS